MDNHPIPQDVTGFQFRLIGDMTIKQFAYLAAGIILAWICLALPIFFLIKVPLIAIFGGLGVLLAFIPLGGRPADTMLIYFFKAVFSPTQYTYTTNNPAPLTTATPAAPEEKKEKKEEKEKKVKIENTDAASFAAFEEQKQPEPTTEEKPREKTESTIVLQQPVLSQLPEDTQQHLNDEETALKEELAKAQHDESLAKDQKEETNAHEKVNELSQELQTIMMQKQELEAKLLELQKQLSEKPQQVYAPTAATPQATENVRTVPKSLSTTVGTPFVTDVPNLICGVIKDPRNNVLPNILIEVKDKDNNPVRAFKTNPLGQFASATPVINGTYTISFEDPNNKQRFDSVEITANGTVLEPLEVISVDAREDLRKELFGG